MDEDAIGVVTVEFTGEKTGLATSAKIFGILGGLVSMTGISTQHQ